MTNWQNVTDYMDTVGTTLKTFSFNKTQNLVRVTIRGNANVTYTIGSQSGTLTPGQSVSVSEKITSFTLTAASGTQAVEVWAIEDGTKKVDDTASDIATINNHTVTYVYNADGTVQSTTEIDANSNVLKTVNYTYNTVGDVATSVTVINGNTVTTTYNYDANANITSTSNVIS